MSNEFVVWVLTPILLGVIVVAVSFVCLWLAPTTGQRLALGIVISGVAFSEMLLFFIALGGWPTFLPHIGLVLMFLIVAGQIIAVVTRWFVRIAGQRVK